MKTFNLMIVAVVAGVMASCGSAGFNGTYQGQAHADSDPGITTDISLKVMDDNTVALAMYHYYRKAFLYTDLATEGRSVVVGDTLVVNFTLPGDTVSTFEAEKTDRHLTFKFVKDGDNVVLAQADPTVVDGSNTVLSPADEAATPFEMKYPKVVFVDGLYLKPFYGKVMKYKTQTQFEYTGFDENGVLNYDFQARIETSRDDEGNTVVKMSHSYDSSHMKNVFTYDSNYVLRKYSSGGNYAWKGEYLYDSRGRLVGYDGTAPGQWMKKRIFYDVHGFMIKQNFQKHNCYSRMEYKPIAFDDYGNCTKYSHCETGDEYVHGGEWYASEDSYTYYE